jgi:hypothetical protein
LDGDDGVYFCGHSHLVVRDAMNCLVPDGGSFIAHDDWYLPVFDEREFVDFFESLKEMPGRSAIKLKEANSPSR